MVVRCEPLCDSHVGCAAVVKKPTHVTEMARIYAERIAVLDISILISLQ